MNRNKKLFQIVFIGTLLLLLVVVISYSSHKNGMEHPSIVPAEQRNSAARTGLHSSNRDIKTQELLDLPVSATSPTRKYATQKPFFPQTGENFSAGNASYQRESSLNKPYTRDSHSFQDTAATDFAIARTQTAPAPGRRGVSSGHKPSQITDGTTTRSESSDQLVQTPFSPYLASLTKEQAASLEKQLNGLSGRVEAAVLRALLPKSKKDINVEKYLSRRSNANSDETGNKQFATVSQQLAQQKTGIMRSMQQAFGPRAGKEAGQLMDSFEQELMSALNQPGQSNEQIRQKTNQISRKYNEKLQQLGQKHGLEKMKQERESKDSIFQQQLNKSYGSEMAEQLGDIMEKYRQKDLALAQQSGTLNEKEYYEQLYANQRSRHKEMETALLKNGKSLTGLIRAEDEEEGRVIGQALKQEQEGKELPRAYRASREEKEASARSVKTEREEKIRVAREIYGEQGIRQIDEVYTRYEAKKQEIMDNDETSLLEKQQQLRQARLDANQSLDRIQKSPEMKALRENRQVESSLQQLMQDPGFAQATPEQKTAFVQTARPILQEMYSKANAIVDDPNLSDEQKEQQIKALQEQAQRQLMGQ